MYVCMYVCMYVYEKIHHKNQDKKSNNACVKDIQNNLNQSFMVVSVKFKCLATDSTLCENQKKSPLVIVQEKPSRTEKSH